MKHEPNIPEAVKLNPEQETVIKEISQALSETERSAIAQIERMLFHMGEEFVRTLLADTLALEEKGGMLTLTGDRRRTPGGVYFYLAKGRLSYEMRGKIFPTYSTGPRPVLLDYDKRGEIIQRLRALLAQDPPDVDEVPAANQPDEAESDMRNTPNWTKFVKIIIQGRPRHWEVVDDTVLVLLTYTPHAQPYPRGVPVPPQQDVTTYAIYVGKSQWEDIEYIAKAGNENLIFEGECSYDVENQAIAVFATKVTTKALDMARSQRDAAAAAKPERPRKPNEPSKAARPAPGQKPKVGGRAQAPTYSASTASAPNPVTDTQAKLHQLLQAAETLRQRITTMEAKGQPGVGMTRKLLENTERQIETLRKQLS